VLLDQDEDGVWIAPYHPAGRADSRRISGTVVIKTTSWVSSIETGQETAAVAVILITRHAGNDEIPTAAPLVAIEIRPAGISTVAIWRAPADWQTESGRKAKRGDRITDLWARLEEEEVQERLGRKSELENVQPEEDDWYDDESAYMSRR